MQNNQDVANGVAHAIKVQAPRFRDTHYMGEPRWDTMAVETFARSVARGSGIKQKDNFVKLVTDKLGPFPNK